MNQQTPTPGLQSPEQPRSLPSPDVAQSQPRQQPLIWRLLGGIPTLLIVAALVGIAVWGHQSGWKLPRFAEVFGSAPQAKDDWCEEHGVRGSECVECNASLFGRPNNFGFCETHGVHQCPFEHPEVAQVTYQTPLSAAMLERADHALKFKAWPENSAGCKSYQRLLQFASASAFNKMGLDVAPVIEKEIVESVAASGEYTFEQPNVTPLYSITPGRIWQLTPNAALGAQVQKGDVLALVEAAEVGKAKAEFLQSFAQLKFKQESLERLNELSAKGSASDRSMREAESALHESSIRYLAAQQALINLGLQIQTEELKYLSPEQLAARIQFLGLPANLAKGLDRGKTTANLLPIFASKKGTVIEVKVTEGEAIDSTKTLFVVADTSRMSVLLNIRCEDAQYIQLGDAKTGRTGSRIRFKPDGDGPAVHGEVVFRSMVVDEKTRTLQFRAVVADPPSNLAAHTFGKAQIIIRQVTNAIAVPSECIHWEGDCHVAFVRDKGWFTPDSPKVFHVRTVRPGITNGAYTEIVAGLLPGEVVASKNSAVLRAQLLKGNLGDGCGCGK